MAVEDKASLGRHRTIASTLDEIDPTRRRNFPRMDRPTVAAGSRLLVRVKGVEQGREVRDDISNLDLDAMHALTA